MSNVRVIPFKFAEGRREASITRLQGLGWDPARIRTVRDNWDSFGWVPGHYHSNVELVDWANDVIDYAKFKL